MTARRSRVCPPSLASLVSGRSPLTSSEMTDTRAMGRARETIDGRIRSRMVGRVEMLPLIHSIVVVTSPMGVQAPPALAARTMMAP